MTVRRRLSLALLIMTLTAATATWLDFSISAWVELVGIVLIHLLLTIWMREVLFGNSDPNLAHQFPQSVISLVMAFGGGLIVQQFGLAMWAIFS